MKNEDIIKVRVSPIFHPWYYEFYLKGLVDFYGENNVNFCYTDSFMWLKEFESTKFRKAFFYYEIEINGVNKKIVISAEDWTDVNIKLYKEVDCYAQVNVDEGQIRSFPKLFPIGPNFGIRYFSLIDYWKFTWKLKQKTGLKNPYIRDYRKNSLKRSYYPFYKEVSSQEKANYTFYLNYPWSKHSKVTENRKLIIQLLQKLKEEDKIDFKGGFSKRRLGYHPGLEQLSASKIYDHKDYLTEVKKSNFVINTPAVHDCLGWKLGEYLALGKTIISLPINRVMPGKFVKDKHYLEIERIDDLEDAIARIINDKEYSLELSKNASNYYKENLAPASVIKRIHENVF